MLAGWFGVSTTLKVAGLLVLPGLLLVGYIGWELASVDDQGAVKVLSSQEVSHQSSTSANPIEARSDKKIWVDVSGAVINPGVKALPEDARVATALEASGGFSAEADTTYVAQVLNFAQPLADGDKLYIPTEVQVKASMPTPVPLLTKINTEVPLLTKATGPSSGSEPTTQVKPSPATSNPTSSPRPTTIEELINVNTAAVSLLEELPGVGPATASKIVEGRPYASLDQLCQAINNSRTCSSLEGLVGF